MGRLRTQMNAMVKKIEDSNSVNQGEPIHYCLRMGKKGKNNKLSNLPIANMNDKHPYGYEPETGCLHFTYYLKKTKGFNNRQYGGR